MSSKHVEVLTKRRDWLKARVKKRRGLGSDASYDEAECQALTWALSLIEDLTRTETLTNNRE